MKDLECPYCDYEFDYSGDPMGQDETTEYQCPKCEKYFIIIASWDVSYYEQPAHCLNGSPHNYTDTHRCPKIIGKKICQRCSMCQKEIDRDATEEEISKEIQKYPSTKQIVMGN